MRSIRAMKILGVDTTTLAGSIGLTEDDRPIAEYSLRIELTHSERLMEAVDRVLQGARVSLDDVDGFAVSHGPGSYTGLRIGIGLIKGLSMATGKPVIPVSSLEVLAYNLAYTSSTVCPLLDARKKEVYAAFFRWNESRELFDRLTEDGLYTPQQLIKFIQGNSAIGAPIFLLGDGVAIHGGRIKSELGERVVLLPPWRGSPSGTSVSVIGYRGFMERKEHLAEDLVPVYIQDFPRQ